MTTKETRDKRIVASKKRLDGLEKQKDGLRDRIAKVDAKIETERKHLEWLQSMPVEDDDQPETESDAAGQASTDEDPLSAFESS